MGLWKNRSKGKPPPTIMAGGGTQTAAENPPSVEVLEVEVQNVMPGFQCFDAPAESLALAPSGQHLYRAAGADGDAGALRRHDLHRQGDGRRADAAPDRIL